MINFLLIYVVTTYIINYFLTLLLVKCYLTQPAPKTAIMLMWLGSPATWAITFLLCIFAFFDKWIDTTFTFCEKIFCGILNVLFFEWRNKDES